MSRMNRVVGAAGITAVLALVGSFSAPAQSATLCGVTVCYEYDPGQSAVALFGLPTILPLSDTLQFNPASFIADAPAPQTTSATFQFSKIYQIGYANGGGAEIASIQVKEFGDYQIINAGTVNANLQLTVVDQINNPGGPANFPELIMDQFNWNTSTPTGFAFSNWQLIGTVNPAATFVDIADVVDLKIQNVLQAFASGSNYAYIQKKLTLTASVVPVPAAAWLFGSALGLIAWVRRRQA